MKHTVRPLIVIAALGLQASLALAGRPLVVDDANTNDKGKGHVETWVTRAEGSTLFSLSPAYAVGEGLEIAGLLARESGGSSGLRVTSAQLKWRITPSHENGCNFAAVLGATRASAGGASSNGSYLNGLATCNRGSAGSYHANLGVSQTHGGGSITTWGLAYERGFGSVTPHIEWFGADGSKPTLQVGLRGQLTDTLQLDGSIGTSDGVTIYTLGVKFTF